MLSLATATQPATLNGQAAPVSRRHVGMPVGSPGRPGQRGAARPVALVVMSAAGVRARIHVLDPRAGVLATAVRSVGVTCASEYAPPLSGLSAVGQWHAMCRGPPEVVTTSLTGAERSVHAAPAAIRPMPRRVALSFLILPAGWVIVTSGATAELRGRRRELRTLRALGWARSEISRRLLREFALLALVMSLAALLVACMCEAVVVHTSPSAWDVLAIPAGVVMTIAAAWWPVRQATAAADPMETARVHRPADWPRGQPWMLGQAIRNLLRAPKRTALRVLVIAASCGALGEELALRWAFGGTLRAPWLGHTVWLQADPIDTSVVITTLVFATVTVAELDWQSARRRLIERRTLQAIGWSAGGVVRLVAWEATLLGMAGGLAAGVIDVASGLVFVHRLPAGMLAAATVVTGTGMLVSLIGALSGARSLRGTPVLRLCAAGGPTVVSTSATRPRIPVFTLAFLTCRPRPLAL